MREKPSCKKLETKGYLTSEMIEKAIKLGKFKHKECCFFVMTKKEKKCATMGYVDPNALACELFAAEDNKRWDEFLYLANFQKEISDY